MKARYSKMPNWFYDEAVPAFGLKAAHVAAYGVILRHADEDGVCWPSLDLIAHEGGMARSTAGTAVNALKTHGLIKVEPGKRAANGRPPNRYQVLGKPASMPTAPERKRRDRGTAPRVDSRSMDRQSDEGADGLDRETEEGLDRNARGFGLNHGETLDRQAGQKKTHRTRPIEGSEILSDSDARASAAQRDDSLHPSEPRSTRKRWSYLPDGFTPTPEHEAIARDQGVSLADEFKKFRDHQLATGRRSPDWDAALRDWLNRTYPERTRSRSKGKAAGELANEVLAIKLPGEDGYSGAESVA